MKIENGKLIFERVKCTMCETGKTERGVFCADYNKPMYGRTCACGSKNKFSHKIVKKEIVDCSYCGGTGRELEDRFSSLPEYLIEPIIEKMTFIFKSADLENIDLDARFLVECYSGENSFAGAQDYIDHRKSDADLILKKVLTQARESQSQALNYIDSKNNLLLTVHYWGYNGGWTSKWVRKLAQV